MEKIIVNPYNHKENDYIQLLVEAIKIAGYEPVPQKGNQKCCKYYLYNWYENVAGNHKLILVIKKVLKIACLKLFGKKIIWIMHNKLQHNQSGYSNLFMRWYMTLTCDCIMILCDETMKSIEKISKAQHIIRKVHKVPLINYTTTLGEPIQNRKVDGTIRLLLFGRIQPYKCIELLIKALKQVKVSNSIELTIAGKADDDDYLNDLKKQAASLNNVSFISKFISVSELKALAKKTDLFMVPLDLRSSLNSSAVMMAFSLGRVAVCPKVGTILEYDDADEFSYSYTYTTVEEHITTLVNIIEQLDCEYNENPMTFSMKGQKALKKVVENNSISEVASCFKHMMNSLH